MVSPIYLPVFESHLLFKCLLFFEFRRALCQLQCSEIRRVVAHGDGFGCMFFVLPSVVFNDAIDVFLTAQFYVVACLLYVHTIKSFDDAEVVEFILHVVLNLLAYSSADCFGLGADEKVVYLMEYEDETVHWVVLEVQAWFMGCVVELQFVDKDVVYMFVP
jgi:hypothetical protein